VPLSKTGRNVVNTSVLRSWAAVSEAVPPSGLDTGSSRNRTTPSQTSVPIVHQRLVKTTFLLPGERGMR